MDVSIYLLTILMAYGTTFISLYIAEVIYDKYVRQYKRYRSLFGGAAFGISLCVVIVIIEQLSLTGVPDGRFTIVMLSTSFFGLIGGATTFILVLTSSYFNGYYEHYFLLANLLVHFTIGLVIYRMAQKNKKKHLYMNLVGATVALYMASLLSNLLVERAIAEVENLNNALFVIFILINIFTFAISVVLIREEERAERIEDLISTYNQLELSESKYKLLFKASDEGFIEYFDKDKKFYFSDKAIEILGLNTYFDKKRENQESDSLIKKDAMSNQELLSFFDEENAERIKTRYEFIDQSMQDRINLTLKFQNIELGERVIEFNGLILRSDNKMSSIIGSVKDMTDAIRKQEDVKRLAYTDKTTGLYNENALFNFLSTLISNQRKGAVIFLNIVEFNQYGFMKVSLRDKIQLHIGNLIKKSFQMRRCYYLDKGIYAVVFEAMEYNDPLYDEANDNFITLLHEIDSSLLVNGINVPITMYGTYLTFPLANIKAEGFIKRGIMSLKAKKVLNRSLNVYSEEQYFEQYHLIRVEQLISSAVENKELYMVYQPQYRCKRCEPVGYEALIRWESSELGFVSPAEFIPIAEKNGSIINIGKFVLEETCKFSLNYHNLYKDYPNVSVNVSYVELMGVEFANQFDKTIQDFGVPREFIHVEITETAYADASEAVKENVGKLRERGYSIHLDDFGTGYSSLSHLGNLMIDVLKIDKSFVDKIIISENYLKLTAGIIELAHRLEIQVIAEGVELEEQYRVLEDIGCDMYQGYYLSKPVKDRLILSGQETLDKNLNMSKLIYG